MKQRSLNIELIDDCVFSAHAATQGGHESLDRIPGATLLGVAASRLYAQLSRQQAWLAFHSGKLRFGDGLPLAGDQPGYPMPLSWHQRKSEQPGQGGRLTTGAVFNFLHGSMPLQGDREAQPKQLRAGYIHADGRWTMPKHALRLKTAIDPGTGRAAEAQLFGYDSLARGQRFAACIEADADFDHGLFDRVIAALNGEILLGRSRSAEYGRARTRPAELPAPVPGSLAGTRLTLWLLADLALADACGQTTLTPDADSLSLPGAVVDWSQTYLRSRRYSPWNAARRGYDCERLVLSAGGVISLDLPAPLTRAQAARLHAGIGLCREAGLGRLWINPPLLESFNPGFAEGATDACRQEAAKPTDPLIAWLEGQQGEWKVEAEDRAEALADAYRKAVESARRYAGVGQGVPFGPSKSQWGRILEAARMQSGQLLFSALFTAGNSGNDAIVKDSADGWSIEMLLNQGAQWQKLSQWLRGQLSFQANSDARAYAHLIRQLAHRVRDDIDKRRV